MSNVMNSTNEYIGRESNNKKKLNTEITEQHVILIHKNYKIV